MTGPLIDIISGARPNFMKIAPIVRALRYRRERGSHLHYRLVHTGQHYDYSLSGQFFEQLGIPAPDVNLDAGSGTQAEQTAAIMTRYERLLLESPSALCLVVGDVTSTMACSIAAQKLRIPVAHVEAGIRSGDWTMPEEINRRVTDAITNYFFTTSKVADENLKRSGVPEEQIFFVGNTMIDTLLANIDRLRQPAFWHVLGLQPRRYIVLTLHRPSNVDDVSRLGATLAAVEEASGGLPVVFPVHPRAARTVREAHPHGDRMVFVDPQPYLEFNYLVKHAKAVITDSGGITEETTVLGIPCLTLRDTTERPETVTVGTNVLIGADPARLGMHMASVLRGTWKKGHIPDRWDGHAGERIVAVLEQMLSANTE